MEHTTETIRLSIKAMLLATVMAVPGTAIAQSGAAQETSPCDRLLETLRQSQPEDAAITMEQAEQYQQNDNIEACETALRQLEDSTDQQAAGAPTDRGAEGEQAQQAAGQEGDAVTVRQAPPTVRVDQGQPEIVIHQPAPTINVEIPQPQITLRMPEPQVEVSSPDPEVSVEQAQPEVDVVQSDQEQERTQVEGAQQPVVQYDAEEPEVNVSQPGEPEIRVERQASREGGEMQEGQQQQQMAAQQDDGQQQASQDAASEGEPIAVSRLKGLDLMDANGDNEIGTVAMVIVDADRRPFVVIDRGDDRVAVHIDYIRAQGSQLVLGEGMQAEDLPVIEDSELQSDSVQELEDDRQIRLGSAS